MNISQREDHSRQNEQVDVDKVMVMRQPVEIYDLNDEDVEGCNFAA